MPPGLAPRRLLPSCSSTPANPPPCAALADNLAGTLRPGTRLWRLPGGGGLPARAEPFGDLVAVLVAGNGKQTQKRSH